MLICASPVTYSPSGDGLNLNIFGEGFIDQNGVRGSGGFENYQTIYIEAASEIKDYSFLGCTSLTKITVPDTISYVGIGAFENCIHLLSFEFPNKVETIHDRTFNKCENLKSVYISSNINSITMTSTFTNCYSLSIYNVSRQNKFFSTDDSLRFLMSSDQKILYLGPAGISKIPRTVETISSYCYNGKGQITVEFPADSELRTIQINAFRSCNMGSLRLPSKLERIESSVFDWSTLDIIYLPRSLLFVDESFLSGSTINGISFDNETSKIFMEVNGVVYNRNMTIIYYITSSATELTVTKEITQVSADQIRSSKTLREVNVHIGNPEYSSYDGILYDNKTEVLLACPGGKKTAIVPESCKVIEGFSRTLIENITVLGCNLEEIRSFGLCRNLFHLNLPNSLKKIHNYCFESCTKLNMSYTFTSNLTYLGAYSFFGTSSIESIDISQCTEITEISIQTFVQCGFKKIILHSGITNIAQNSFKNAVRLQSIELPNLKTIENEAFLGCKNLRMCTIGEGINVLPAGVFSGCRSLQSFQVPNSVTEIKSNVFKDCTSLKNVTFGKGTKLETINPNFVSGCESLKEFIIPSTVSNIMLDAFAYSSGLQSILVDSSNPNFQSWEGVLMKGNTLYAFPGGREKCFINASVLKINEHAFYQCNSLVSVVFSEGSPVKSIEDSTFYGCSKLLELQLPEKLENVSAGAFNGCSSIESISFGSGESLQSLGSSVFQNCESLKSVDLGDECKVTEIPINAFKGCKNLLEVNMGPNILYLSDSAFEGCECLVISRIQQNITIIGANCFNGCKLLKEIFIPASVNLIGASAFGNCPKLELVKYCGINDITNNIFTGSVLKFAYVPVGYKGVNFGGIPCLKLLDTDCAIPSQPFTVGVRDWAGSVELILHDTSESSGEIDL